MTNSGSNDSTQALRHARQCVTTWKARVEAVRARVARMDPEAAAAVEQFVREFEDTYERTANATLRLEMMEDAWQVARRALAHGLRDLDQAWRPVARALDVSS